MFYKYSYESLCNLWLHPLHYICKKKEMEFVIVWQLVEFEYIYVYYYDSFKKFKKENYQFQFQWQSEGTRYYTFMAILI